MKKVLAYFIVLCMCIMSFGMVADAAIGCSCGSIDCSITGDDVHNIDIGVISDSGTDYGIAHVFLKKDHSRVVTKGFIEGKLHKTISGVFKNVGNTDGICGAEIVSDESLKLTGGNATAVIVLVVGEKTQEEVKEDKSNDDDNHDSHDDKPAGPTAHQSKQDSIYSEIGSQLSAIDSSAKGDVIIDGKDLVNSLPKATMQKIAENRNATIYFTYMYNDAKYTTAIPEGAAIDSSLDWYGPVYLMANYPTVWHETDVKVVNVIAPVR